MDPLSVNVVWDAWIPVLQSLPVRVACGLAGAGMLLALALGLRRRAVSPLLFLATACPGLLLTAFAFAPGLLEWFIHIPYFTRLRVAMGALSFIVLFITMEALRKDVLEERYALLWLATGALIFLFALFPWLVALLKVFTGIGYTNALMAVLLSFLVLVAFHFSLALSRHHHHQSRAAQHQAVLEQRIARLEEALRQRGEGGVFPPPTTLPEDRIP